MARTTTIKIQDETLAVPRVKISIDANDETVWLANILIKRKLKTDTNYTQIYSGSVDASTFEFVDSPTRGETYDYVIDCDDYEIKEDTSPVNFWLENFENLENIQIAGDGSISQVDATQEGTLTAKADLLDFIRTTRVQYYFLFDIGTFAGPDKNGEEELPGESIMFYFDEHKKLGLGRFVNSQSQTGSYVRTTKSSQYQEKKGEQDYYWTYRSAPLYYSASSTWRTRLTFNTSNQSIEMSRDDNNVNKGKQYYQNKKDQVPANILKIKLKNGAKLKTTTEYPTYKRVITNHNHLEQELTVGKDYDGDIGAIINQNAAGFTFSQFDKKGFLKSSNLTSDNLTKFLEIQGQELPIIYQNDINKAPTCDMVFLSDLEGNYKKLRAISTLGTFFLLLPKSWNKIPASGWYVFESVEIEKMDSHPESFDFIFVFEGCRQVAGSEFVYNPPTYDYIKSHYTDYEDIKHSLNTYQDMKIFPIVGISTP